MSTAAAKPAEIGQVLRRLRTAYGWSGYELERRAGLPQRTVSQYENSRRLPGVANLRKLARALGITLSVLQWFAYTRAPEDPRERRMYEGLASMMRMQVDMVAEAAERERG
jgi:transcriptional regulator with XRE-family HTH domain